MTEQSQRLAERFVAPAKKAATSVLSSERRLSLTSAIYEVGRRMRGREPTVVFFHRVSDAWSWLLAQGLRELCERYQIELEIRVVSTLPVDCVTDPAQLDRYAAYDAMRLARAWSFEFPQGVPPPRARNTSLAERIILARPTLQTVLSATAAAWRRDDGRLAGMASEFGAADEREAAQMLSENERLLSRRGHYLGATAWFQGEWFWGLDRLAFLESRLQHRGLLRGEPVAPSRFVPIRREQGGSPVSQSLEFYFSFRSPYSYLAASQVFNLADRLGLDLHLRPLLPMVRRGIPLPRRKLHYIITDAARVARAHGIAFGPMRDPLGAGVERCLAVFHAAAAHGHEREFVLASMRAIWSEAADLSRDDVLLEVAQRAGIGAGVVNSGIAEKKWQAQASANAAALAVLGLWGVPSFCLRGADEKPVAIGWGQDRIWAIERAALGIDVALPVPGLVQ